MPLALWPAASRHVAIGATCATTAPGGGTDTACPPPGPWRPYGRGARLLPQDADTDGMTVLRYVRAP